MSVPKEHSHDKAEWVKWPHLETHWHPQHSGTQHHSPKKTDHSKSHSWWWDSHISPKSSKWLQENLAEMDSKVNAMLKIIEEDADSFAKRAEMYYQRRPELVNLVEEFYRTYRALVERHTFLTKELRQNIAPALRAQLGGLFANSPYLLSDMDARTDVDGLSIGSLQPYTFSEGLEVDVDSLTDYPAKRANDDVVMCFANSTGNFETFEPKIKPPLPSSEEKPLTSHHTVREFHMPVDATSLVEFMKRIEVLEDEKKGLMIKLGEDDGKIADPKSEVSDLLMRARALEADDKLAKDRLNSLLQLKHPSEADNLRSSHSLITCKEERNQLTEECDHGLQGMLATGKRIHQLEQEVSLFEQKLLASHAEMLTAHEKSKKFQVECEKLQQILSDSQEESKRDAASLKKAYESCLNKLQKQVIATEEDNEGFKKQIDTQNLKAQELEQKVIETAKTKIQLEQALIACKESKDALELEKSMILSRIFHMQREFEATKDIKQQLTEQIAQRNGKVLVLEETARDIQACNIKLETERDDLRMQMLALEVKFQELQKERDSYLSDSQRLDTQCKGLKVAEVQVKEKLALSLEEITRLREGKLDSDRMLAQANLELEELQMRLNAFFLDKRLLMQTASGHVNSNENFSQESRSQTTHFKDVEEVLFQLILGKGMLEKQQADTLILLSVLEKASKEEIDNFKKTAEKHAACIAELQTRLATLTKERDLLGKQGIEVLQSNSNTALDLSLFETDRVEASKLVEQLLTDAEELKKSRDQALLKCKDFDTEGLALKQEVDKLKAYLELEHAEGVSLQNDKSGLESELARVRLETETLQSQASAYSSEVASLRLELVEALEQVRITKNSNSQLQARADDYQAECRRREHDLQSHLTRCAELEGVMASLLHEKKAFERKQAEAQNALLCLEEEKRQLTEEVEKGHSFAIDLNERLAKSQIKNRQLLLDLEQARQDVVRLQENIARLSDKYMSESTGFTKFEEQISLLKVEKEISCKALATSEGEVCDLEVRVSELIAEITALGERVSQMSEVKRGLEPGLADMRQQKEAFSEKLATSAHHVIVLQNKLDSSRELKGAHQVELQQHAERIQALEMDVESMRTKADKCEKGMVCEQQRSLVDIAGLQTRIHELDGQVSHYMEVNRALVKGFEEQKEKLQMQVQDSSDIRHSLEAELSMLHEAVFSVEESTSTPVHVQSRSLDADTTLPGRFEHLHQKIGSLLEERKQLVKEVGSQKGENGILASRVVSLEQDKNAVHSELMRALEEREQMVTSLSVEVSKVKFLEEALKRTQQALEDTIEERVAVAGQLKTSSEEGESLRNRLEALQVESKKNQQTEIEAARETEKLAGELSQLRQVHAVVENELSSKVLELSSVHEHTSKLLLSKGLLEKDSLRHLYQLRTLNEEVARLQHQLQDAEQKIGKLEDELSKVVIECLDEKGVACEAQKDIHKLILAAVLSKEEMAAMCTQIHELEQDISRLQDEKKILSDEMEALRIELEATHGEREDLMLQLKDEKETLSSSFEALQSEMTVVQAENKHLKAQLKAASLELAGKEMKTRNIQEQLMAAESHISSVAEALLSMKSILGTQVKGWDKELSQFKATNTQAQKDLASQLELVSKLKEELNGLLDEKSLLQEERDRGNKELADVRKEAAGHLNELEVAANRGKTNDAELLQLSALTQSLKQSLVAKELQISNLLEDMRKSTECQGAAEKRYFDEIGLLQREELKWRSEASATSDLMAEKVASLRMENAALHQDLSLKIELVLKQQKEVEFLTEECKNLSQALQDMFAEMSGLRNDLQIFKDVVIPSMEERAVELQDEIEGLTVSNERYVAKIVILSTQLKDAKVELLLLHEENSILEVKLIFNVEMLKHVDVVLETANAQSATLCDNINLQENRCWSLEQMLIRTTDENVMLSKKLSSITQEKKNSVAEAHHLRAILAEVEQLRRELAHARRGIPLANETDSVHLHSLFNSYKGVVDAGGLMRTSKNNEEAAQNLAKGFLESISAPVHKFQQASSGFKIKDFAFFTETQPPGKNSILTSHHLSGLVEKDCNLGTTVLLSVSSSPVEIDRLKEEIAFLQEKIQSLEFAAMKQGTSDFLPSALGDVSSSDKNSTTSSLSTLPLGDTQDRLDEIHSLKEENQTLIEEIESLKGQSLASWMEHDLIETIVRDLQSSKDVLQEKNGHLNSQVISCKEDIVGLQEESLLLQQKCTAILQDMEASTQEKRKSEETLGMLEDAISSLKWSNRHLKIENELANDELKKLQGALANVHDEGTEVIAQMKSSMVTIFKEVKLMIDECRKEMGDEGVLHFMMGSEQACSEQCVRAKLSLLEPKESVVMKSVNEKGLLEAMPEPVATARFFVTELRARAEEANMLADVLVCIGKTLSMFSSGSEHDRQRHTPLSTINAMSIKGEAQTTSSEKDLDLEGSVHHHKLADRLHQIFVDEKLENKLLELKEGRKQLEEDLNLRLEEVQRMESELEKLEGLIGEKGGGRRVIHEEKQSKNKQAEESVKELREMLAQQRGQICKMKEEVMLGEAQQEVAAEDQVTVLVSMESAPDMEGWNEQQVSSLSIELESLRSLNRRHSAELRTISQDLQSVGSIIKSAQDQLLQDFLQGKEGIVSSADLRTQKSCTIDMRAQNSRAFTDSAQQLLSPSAYKVRDDFESTSLMSSEGSIRQFPLKPRNFGMTWFMLLFSPDRKASSLLRGKRDKATWAPLGPNRGSSSSGSAALVAERRRSKVVSCWACVSNTDRRDSFEHR